MTDGIPSFAELLQARYSRRALLQAGVAGGAALALPGANAAGAGSPPVNSRTTVTMAPSRADALVLAAGHRHDVVARWGEALLKGAPSLDPRLLPGSILMRPDAAAKQAQQFGTNCDAIQYFPLAGSSRRGVLCVNHEYVRLELTFSGLPADSAERMARLPQWVQSNPGVVSFMQAAQGVSVLQVERRTRGWQMLPGAAPSRRITANTPCDLAGPARGALLLQTRADPEGVRALGTIANCAGGKTPWGTYLTAEENINDYFGYARSWATESEDFATLAAHARFPLKERSLYGWEHADRRFDVRAEPREALRFGWIVEIDPMNPTAAPRKRTALGRFCHEGANTHLARDGRVAVYMGDDEKFEYVYKFVTRGRFDPKRPAANRDLLDDGTLYVARFDADGSGTWLPLVFDPNGPLNPSSGFMSQADVVIKARAAADLLGATPMDRPEDIEPSPVTGRVYISLTNNVDRSADRQRDFVANREIELGVDAANPRPANEDGQIVELIEQGDDAAATRFTWQVFLLAGDPRGGRGRLLTRYEDLQRRPLQSQDTWFAGQTNAAALSPLSSPDNLGFDPEGRLWIVTDTDKYRSGNNGCYVVPTSGPERGLLRQIASAPVGAEVCGCEFTPDGRTLFLSIQHPGLGGRIEAPRSHWPDGDGLPPRSAIVAIEREDGAPL